MGTCATGVEVGRRWVQIEPAARLDDLAWRVVTEQRGKALRSRDQARDVNPGCVAHQLERVRDFFAADVAGRTRRVRTAADAAQRGVETIRARVDRGKHVGEP